MNIFLNKYLRIILCLFLLTFIGTDIYAQKKKKKKKKSAHTKDPHVILGDKYYSVLEYIKSAEEYKKAYDADTTNKYALYKLAESYRQYFDYFNAEKYYKQAVKSALHTYPLSRYWYGIMLKDNGRYLEAQEQFNLFRKEYKASTLEAELYKEKAMQEAEGCKHALEEIKKPQRNYHFKTIPTPVNTENADYGAVIIENDSVIALTSAREESTGKEEAGLGGKLSDIYRFKKARGDDWMAIAHQHDGYHVMNTPFNESSGSFNGDKTKFYFTRCDEKIKVGDFLEYNCAIYVSNFIGGKWEKPIRLNSNVNKQGQWNAQPSISPDGRLLFFVSRRPGGLGMHDIWYCTSIGDENWSTAHNMGDQVNTLFSDVSPKFYGEEKILFFSSNGHEGFGGLDVFFVHEDSLMAGLYSDTANIVKNIGLPFNSSRDDQYFVLGEKKGYISSNREGGKGNYDIYSFDIESKETLIAYINNDTTQAKSISVVGTLQNQDTKLPASDVGVILADDKNNKLKTSTTNEEGKFRFENLPTDKNYKVQLKEENAKITKEVKYIVDNVEVKNSDKAASKTLFDNIYFDFDKYELKTEAQKILDKLISFYKKYPEVQIEMSANTDSFGSEAYNKVLSFNRGNTALEYLISKGVDKSALVVNAQGEGKPVASNNSDIGRQLNRRVEFFIIGGPGYAANVSSYTVNPNDKSLYYVAQQFNMTVEELNTYVEQQKTSISSFKLEAGEDYYVVQPKNTLYTIAKLYGMSLNDLREINGITSTYEGVVVGQKLKVRSNKEAPSDQYYLVKEGETLYSISKKFGLAVDELVKMNNMDGYILRKNMLLKIKN